MLPLRVDSRDRFQLTNIHCRSSNDRRREQVRAIVRARLIDRRSHIDVGSRGTKLTIEACSRAGREGSSARESRSVTCRNEREEKGERKRKTQGKRKRGSSITELTDEDRAQKREITSAGTMVDSHRAERFKRLDLSDLHFVNGNSCIFEAGPGQTGDSCDPSYLSFQKQLIVRFLSLFHTLVFFYSHSLLLSFSFYPSLSPLPLSYTYIYIHTHSFSLLFDKTMGSGRGGACGSKSFPIT